jgi:hypothetical protein
MCADQTGLPAIFDDDGDYSGKLIRGAQLKFGDKVWATKDGTPLHENDQFLVVGTRHDVQRFIDGLPEVISERPLPDVDELNAAVPKEEWPIGKFSGQPEAPWKHVFSVYLVRVSDGTLLTCINSTSGQRIAYSRLNERIKTMSLLRGVSVLPLVKLSWTMMSSAFGPRPRPDFTIVEWRQIGGDQAQIEPPKPAEQTGQPVKEPVSKPVESKPKKTRNSVKPARIGKPVSEPSLQEELNDEIGF